MTMRKQEDFRLDISALFKRHLAIPSDHGSWVFIFSPLWIGLFAGGNWRTASATLVLAAIAGFLIRQPITIALKIYRGRRHRRDLGGAWFWIAVYGLIGAGAACALLWLGYGYLLWLAAPGIPVFIWHLYLVGKRAERRQPGVEILGAGVLSLTAPAAYWIGLDSADARGWLLFLLVWFQSAASIVYAYLRLAQRELSEVPPLDQRMRLGWRALAYTSFNLLAVAGLATLQLVPIALCVPYLLQWGESIYGALYPAINVKPTRIGIRQLMISSLFTVLFILTWK